MRPSGAYYGSTMTRTPLAFLLKKPRGVEEVIFGMQCLTLGTTGLGSARLVGAGRDRADVASAGCVVVAVFEASAAIARLNDIAVMGQVIEQRGCHLGVAEHTGPFS
jgi:hypothetical protein